MTFALSSTAFSDGQPIPEKYARDGGNLSPPLGWSDPPKGTVSYALLVEDPDAPSGTFRHWALYNIRGDWTGLLEGRTAGDRIRGPGHGTNSFGNAYYDGPAPPPGHGTHHYIFRLAALDVATLDVEPDAGSSEIWSAARAHTIGEAKLTGTFER